MEDKTSFNGTYSGTQPYVFVSYSHRDREALEEVLALLRRLKVRFWFDNGLNSGDNWNGIIAERLESATVCLLLLSPHSAVSEYVKNELQFAINHCVPIHTLMLTEFDVPSDVEIMITRIQAISMRDDYAERLSRALPPELFPDGALRTGAGEEDERTIRSSSAKSSSMTARAPRAGCAGTSGWEPRRSSRWTR